MGTLLQITEIALQTKETHVLRFIESIWWNFVPNSLYGIGEVITWPKWPTNVGLFFINPPTLPMLSLSGLNQLTRNVYLSICVFVYLYICIFVFACLTHGNVIFDILGQSSFQKYTTWWVFPELCHMLYLYICVFVYLCAGASPLHFDRSPSSKAFQPAARTFKYVIFFEEAMLATDSCESVNKWWWNRSSLDRCCKDWLSV